MSDTRMDGYEPVNLDGLSTEPDDLKEMSRVYGLLAEYALAKAAAMRNRKDGAIRLASLYEADCEQLYQRLPAWARW